MTTAGFEGPLERILKLDEVCRRVSLGRTTVYKLVEEERFPAPYKVSPYTLRWSETEIVTWIAEVKDGFERKQRKF